MSRKNRQTDRHSPSTAPSHTDLEYSETRLTVSAREAWSFLGCGKTTFYHILNQNLLTRIPAGRRVRYLRAELEELARKGWFS